LFGDPSLVGGGCSSITRDVDEVDDLPPDFRVRIVGGVDAYAEQRIAS